MTLSKIERVGIIGLGRMGRPMTRHLIEKGFAVTGFDVSGEAMARWIRFEHLPHAP